MVLEPVINMRNTGVYKTYVSDTVHRMDVDGYHMIEL
jgi:hypothetical protein